MRVGLIYTVTTCREPLQQVERYVTANLAAGADHLFIVLDHPDPRVTTAQTALLDCLLAALIKQGPRRFRPQNGLHHAARALGNAADELAESDADFAGRVRTMARQSYARTLIRSGAGKAVRRLPSPLRRETAQPLRSN